jgi:HEAT repeat protein
MIDALLGYRILKFEAAVALARRLALADPLLDVHLIQKMLAHSAGDVRVVPAETALWVLSLVDEISDCSRLSSFLVQLMRHPSAHVRSKVALLMGRANLNLNRVQSLLASGNARQRANVVEALWRRDDKPVLTILRAASKDGHPRVSINALVGLCLARDRAAYHHLQKMAASSQAAERLGAAWAMGEIADPAFSGPLGELIEDGEEQVRSMAAASLKKLPVAAPSPTV